MGRERTPKFQALPEDQKPNLDDPKALFASARIAAARSMPICAPAIRALTPVWIDPDRGLGTFGTDKYYRVYVDLGIIHTWVDAAKAVSEENPCGTCGDTSHHPIAYVGGTICHEAWHPLRKHYERKDAISAVNNVYWNIGADEEINDDLLEIFKHCDMPKLCIPPTHLQIPSKFEGHEDGKLAEHYYNLLITNPPKGTPDHEGCGSACDGKPRPWDMGEPSDEEGSTPGLSEAEGRMIRKEVATNIKDASKNRGDMPGGFLRWADKELDAPKYDWRAELAKALRWSVNKAQGDEERTYRRLGRRCASIGYSAVLPSTYKPAPLVKIVQDTSGSMSDKAIMTSMSEAEGIIRAVGAYIEFVACDATADKAQKVDNVRDIQVHGGGGTDMRKGIEAALEGDIPNIIVLFTDGYTPWPEEPILNGRVRLVVGLVGEHACDVNEPPTWATVVRITGDDIVTRDTEQVA